MATFDLRIDNLVYGGEGIGRMPDGRAVFVPFTIPGELIRTRVMEDKRHFARGELVEVLEASPQRVMPRCSHFTICGGCHYQHMSYLAQLQAKSAILQEQLMRIGGINELPAVEIVNPADPWYYRNQVQFHLTQEGKLGYQKVRSRQTFAIRECHLPEEPIMRLWPQIDIEPMAGVERIILRVGQNGDMMLILESADPQPIDFSIESVPLSIIQQGAGGSLVLAGSDHINMEVLGRQFQVSSSAFFQINTMLAEEMVSHLMKDLLLDEMMTVLDVYSGVGLFSAFLAPRVKQLVGIEISTASCADFVTNLDEYDRVSLYEAAAEDVLAGINFHPDVIIMDPPRDGLGAKAVEGILAQGARYLAYFSCDPATLSRDARRLISGGYGLTKMVLFDMFPQTYHIESLTYWVRT